MLNVTLNGLPAIAWEVGFIVVGSLPIWAAAKLTGADRTDLLSAMISLLIGTVGAFFAVGIGGFLGLILVPVAYILSFKFILRTSIFGAVMLGIVALAGYYAMGTFIGGGMSMNSTPGGS